MPHVKFGSNNKNEEEEDVQVPAKSEDVKKRKRQDKDNEQGGRKEKSKPSRDSEEADVHPTNATNGDKSGKQPKAQEPAPKKDKKERREKNTSSGLDSAAADEWRQANNITVSGEDVPAPFVNFKDAHFPDYITSALEQTKFKNPTPIQAQGWPVAVAGRDMIGLAETGSGKTLAFVIPAVIHTKNKSASIRKKGPSVLVLAPTRELAQQIEVVAQSVCSTSGMTSVCIFGGVPKYSQIQALKSGAEVIIATPGRLIDLMNEEAVHLGNVSFLVLDEADRMLDMGFGIQIKEVMKQITDKNRQTAMYSATWPDDVQRLAANYFKEPVRITIGSENLSGASNVTQIVQVCEEYEKKSKLKALLNQLFTDNCRILVFMLYKKSCERMAVDLQAEGWPCDSIHGDKSQNARDSALARFKSGDCPILVATDVAARGLDIKNVSYVINVEFPLKCEDYVHRIGRTGRAGASGKAYTLFTAEDKVHARELVQIMEESNQTIPPELAKIADKAPGIKAKKTAMQSLYGDFAKADPRMANKKATRIVFNNAD